MSCFCEPGSYHKRLTILSGCLLAIGLAAAYFSPGHTSVPLLSELPDAAGLVFLVAAIVGGTNFVPAGFRSLFSFSLDMDLLMAFAMIAASLIGEFAEAAAIGFLFSLSELAEKYAVDRSRAALDALMALAPESAERVTPQGVEVVSVESIWKGDVVVVRPGGRVPIDGNVTKGATSIEEAAITGESIPSSKSVGDRVYAGTMNLEGYIEIRADREASETLLSRIVQMVEEAEDRKAPSEQFVRRFARFYTPIVLILAFGVVLFPPIFLGEPLTLWFTRGLAMLVIACPCALIISTPVAVISAITSASRNGVLIKGGDHLESLADIRALAFDKTGTLTKGVFEVTEVIPLNGTSEADVLSVAGALEEKSGHPIAASITRCVSGAELPEVEAFESVTGLGVSGNIDGVQHMVGKPQMLPEALQQDAEALLNGRSGTAVVVANEGVVLGAIALSDVLREDVEACLASLREGQIKHITMLTGDRDAIAQDMGRAAGVDSVKSELLPEGKLKAIGEMEQLFGPVAMVGDGVNDAPALASARVGVAMGVIGSDAALETADAALMSDDLSKMPYLFRLSRLSRRVIRQNVGISILVKALLAAGAATGVVSLAAAIVVGDIGMSLAVTANALRLARCK
jgi:Cd2+/Zn2+-exporting ATPase